MVTIAAVLLLLLAASAGGVHLGRTRERTRRYRSLLEQLPETVISAFDHDLRFTQILGAAAVDSGFDPPATAARSSPSPAGLTRRYTPPNSAVATAP